jgi:hypothetical protein
MTKFIRFLAIAVFALLSQASLAEEDPHLYGCYFSQAREPGKWVTSTAALFIEKAPDGILLHGSVSSWHNSWISTPDDESPVLLKKSANKFVFQGKVDTAKPNASCKLILHYDKENIYVKKYDQGCAKEWSTGDGIGPSEMSIANKQPSSDMCLAYLGIIRK